MSILDFGDAFKESNVLLPDSTSRVLESELRDIYANARASIRHCAICREATKGGGYRIDILERTPEDILQIYEIKCVDDIKQIGNTYYKAIGQITFYSSFIKSEHVKRIVLIVKDVSETTEIRKERLDCVKERLGIHTIICTEDEILSLKSSHGYRQMADDKKLSANYLDRFDCA